jgi:hypothetical protein
MCRAAALGSLTAGSTAWPSAPNTYVTFLQVDEVKNIMSDNIEKVLSRGEKLDLLVDKTDNLMFEVRKEGCAGTPAGDSAGAVLHCKQSGWRLQLQQSGHVGGSSTLTQNLRAPSLAAEIAWHLYAGTTKAHTHQASKQHHILCVPAAG